MIEGLNIRCNVGPLEILRSPRIELVSRRRAVVSRARIVIPDPEGVARAALALGQQVTLRFGYRGEANFWQEWEGSVAEIGQPGADAEAADAITVQAVGLEKALTTTLVKDSFYGEPAAAVARRLLSATGLPVGAVEIPGDVLPYQVFSNVPVARAIKQLANTLTRAFGYDMSRHALWLGASGLTWSAGDEPGAAYAITTCENLIANTPPETSDGVGVVTSVLLPGLTHSRLVHITDTRRGLNITARALDVVHSLAEGGNTTIVTYGKDAGWA
ncbi:hypothetical protein [uncultured Desulfovibrio sp.]|uniref:hypothetical protein n=1 Tax=uncultured Desulfovibrio sp. TaxID=167968 RepID=UPI0025FFE844|nr:hypothetical protein [uncultured Desulfovibrio sp.]